MQPRFLRIVSALVALCAMATVARAQEGGALQLRAAQADTARIDAGTALTTVFRVKNGSADSSRLQPTVTVPRGWSLVMGGAPFIVAAGGSDTWLVGVSVPASAPAGAYVIRAAVKAGDETATDSVMVHVNEHRALEILPIDVPGWVLAGSKYESRFLVRNRGNVAATIALTGATSRGTRCDAMPPVLTLAPGASAPVTVRVAMTGSLERTTDDVLELSAADKADPTVRTTASTRTTVISTTGVSRFATIPSTLSLRSIGGASGVSPVSLVGAGLLSDNTTAVDFSLQAPTARRTEFGFDERDEYRVNFKTASYALKLGDNPYGFSELTSSGMLGTGAQFSGASDRLAFGVYGQHLRWMPGSKSDEGVYLGSAPDTMRGAGATFVERQTAGGAVSVGSVSGHLHLPIGAMLQLEAAASDSGHANGIAERARISGLVRDVNYDFGLLKGNQAFAGLARGTAVEDGSISARFGHQITIGASGNTRVSDFATPLNGVPAQHFSSATLNASYGGLAALEYGWLSRHDEGPLNGFDGTQRGLRVSSSVPLGPASVSVSYEHGTVNLTAETVSHSYNVISVSAQTRLWNGGTFSLFGAHNDGTTLTGASSGVANAGVNLDVFLPLRLELALSTSAQRATLGVFDGSGAWFSQSDARLDYHFVAGQTLSLRVRVWQNPLVEGNANARAFYLEFRTPLKLPVGPSRSEGRAEGIIVDAGTGGPLVGALVRLADQAAVSDKNGHVSFSGLSPSHQRVSLDASGAAAGAMLVGDAFVDIREHMTTPAKFNVSVVRGGTVRVLVSRLAPALGTLATNKDSMVAVGVEANVLVALESGRDTIYQSSDDRGRLDFGAVSPGRWTMIVMPGELPDHHVFETDRMEVNVLPGEHRVLELHLIPQRRTVTFIGGNAEPLTAKQLPQLPLPPREP